MINAVKVLAFVFYSKENNQLLQVYLIYESNQWKLIASTKFSDTRKHIKDASTPSMEARKHLST